MTKLLGTGVRVVLLAGVLAGAGGMVWWWHDYRTAGTRTHTVDVGGLLSGVTVSGTVRNRQKTSLAPEVVAAVKSICVHEGQKVGAGDVVIELDDCVVAAEIAKAEAAVQLAEQKLAEVRAGPRKEEVTQAREAVNAAASELSYAKTNDERVQKLAAKGIANSSEVLLSEKRLKVAQANLKSMQAALELLLAGTRAEQVASARAEVRVAKAEVRRCQALRGKYVLHAPHAGVVTAKYVHVGEVVSPGQVLVHLNNVERTEIRAQVQETQLAGIQPGHTARVLPDAYPDRPLEAVVERILPRVDPESGSVTVLLTLAQPDRSVTLMDGMAVDIAMIREQRDQVVRVPVEGIEGEAERAVVWVQSGSDFVKRPVVAGARDGQWVEIRSGLKPGEVIRMN